MFIILFNLSSFIVLSALVGAYMGCGKASIDPLTIKSWDEFLMLRELMVEWSTFTYYLGWTIFSVVALLIIVDAVYIWKWKKMSL